MKYFTKYLSVEGEIREGDMILREWYPSTQGFRREIVSYRSSMQSLLEKKVKLFLCSRDIQVDDKVYGNYPTEDGSMILNTKEEMKLAKLGTPTPFKVIGELSPDATWVKEGDEFDENDIAIRAEAYGKNGKLLDVEDVNYWCYLDYDSIDILEEEDTIAIMGPCGHFH